VTTPHYDLKFPTALAKAALPHGWQATTEFCHFKTERKSRCFHLLL